MRHITITPAATAVTAGLALCAYLLVGHARTAIHSAPTPQQLTDAHRAGYTLALTHVSRGLLTAAPEEL
ncbi:hypothetical protein ACIBKZ_09575 [Streptomyces sp. NPDC050421]|uniref:hypothetical protein n=1 Tax=Streptomyces sp. NPDC050421 TaxID=3365613 RepID=UPI0037A5FB4D